MLDEPSLGLAPKAAEELFAALGVLREEGMTLVVVDQMATHALALSDHAYLLETGAVVKQGPADELARDPGLEEAYLGGSHAKTAGAEASGLARRGEPSAGALDISKRLLTNGTTAS
jgi:ABC-type lipopolysaccharide export system ATPase subunit